MAATLALALAFVFACLEHCATGADVGGLLRGEQVSAFLERQHNGGALVAFTVGADVARSAEALASIGRVFSAEAEAEALLTGVVDVRQDKAFCSTEQVYSFPLLRFYDASGATEDLDFDIESDADAIVAFLNAKLGTKVEAPKRNAALQVELSPATFDAVALDPLSRTTAMLCCNELDCAHTRSEVAAVLAEVGTEIPVPVLYWTAARAMCDRFQLVDGAYVIAYPSGFGKVPVLVASSSRQLTIANQMREHLEGGEDSSRRGHDGDAENGHGHSDKESSLA